MITFRKHSAGYLLAPRRGIPPPAPDGYERAEGDPFVFLPILDFCQYREKIIVNTSCCGNVLKTQCTKYIKLVTRADCKTCMELGQHKIGQHKEGE